MAQAKKKNGPRTTAKAKDNEAPKRVAIYRRISTDEANQPHSLTAQETDCRRYLEARPGWTEVANIADSASGGSIDRPGLLKVMQMATNGEIDAVVFTKLDRLTRRSRDFYNLIEFFDEADVSIVSLEGMIDTTTPAGRMMASLIVAVAQWERETIVERIFRGIRAKVDKGLTLHTRPPFGYSKDPETKRLVIDEQEARIVKMIFRFYQAGAGAGAIATKLNEKGLRRRGKPWDKPTVLKVVSCETVAGRIDYDGEMLPAIHEAIIDPEQYEKVQDLREARGEHRSRAVRRNNDYLLSGLIRCGVCGLAYLGHGGTSRNGSMHRYYTCTGRIKRVGQHRCENESVSAEALESVVIDLVLETYSDLGVFESAVEEARKLAPNQVAELELRLKMLSEEASQIQRALNRWTASFEEGELSPSTFKGRVLELEARGVEISIEEAKISEEILMLHDSTPSLIEISNHAEMIERVLRADGNSEEKKRVLSGLVESLVVKPHRLVEPTLRVPSVSNFTNTTEDGPLRAVRTENPLVEVMGIEPTTSSLRTKRSAK